MGAMGFDRDLTFQKPSKSWVTWQVVRHETIAGMENAPFIAGWWLSPTPLKNDGVFVSWDDDIPNIWKNKKNV